jgi:hypothetical protein
VTGMENQFPDVSCPRCETWTQVFTVPLRLVPSGAIAWQMLCRECFQSVLGVEPGEELMLRPIHRNRGRRR